MDVTPKTPTPPQLSQATEVRYQPAWGCELPRTGTPPPLSFLPHRATSTCGSSPPPPSPTVRAALTTSLGTPGGPLTPPHWRPGLLCNSGLPRAAGAWPHFPRVPSARPPPFPQQSTRGRTRKEPRTPSLCALALGSMRPPAAAGLGDRTAWLGSLGMTCPRAAPWGWNPGDAWRGTKELRPHVV